MPNDFCKLKRVCIKWVAFDVNKYHKSENEMLSGLTINYQDDYKYFVKKKNNSHKEENCVPPTTTRSSSLGFSVQLK